MLSRSPLFAALNKGTLAATGIAILTALPTLANASTLTSQSNNLNLSFTSEVANQSTSNTLNIASQQGWLIADKEDDDKKGHGHERKKHDRDDDEREGRIDLNRAKNLARQAAEYANGGIQVYRTEASMHGSAQKCPYVDNGDSWTFTFLGGRPGSSTMTIQSVVTVYKATRQVVVAYNGPVRTVQQGQFVSFTTTQRTVLVDMLRGTCGCSSLLSNTLRTQIISQSRSLPPGIQKQLLRGKGLPPGIAKKLVLLPKQVNNYINLPAQYDLAVIGSNLVVIDQVRYVVVDMISSVL